MYKSLIVFVILISFGGINVVYSDTEVFDRGTEQQGRSFVEIGNKSDSNRVNPEDNEAGKEKIELICKNTHSDTVVKFLVQVAFPDSSKNNFKIDNLIGTCDADSNKALAKVVMSVPQTYIDTLTKPFVSVLNWVNGTKQEEQVKKISKIGRCKTSDEVLTFWLKDNAQELEVKCGEDNNSNQVDNNRGYSNNYANNTTQQSPPRQSLRQPQQPQQFQQFQQYPLQQPQQPYYQYDNGWEEYNSPWDDLSLQEDESFDNYDDEWDSGWDEGWNNDGTDIQAGEYDETENNSDYGPTVSDMIDFGEPRNLDEEVTYYGEEELFTESTNEDPISILLQDSPSVVGQNNFDDWGFLDNQYSDLTPQDLASFDEFNDFKRYYSGEVTKEEWQDWREWVFTHNRNALNFEFESGFYDDTKTTVEYPWYNPYRWWLSFNGWLTEVNPLSSQYDI